MIQNTYTNRKEAAWTKVRSLGEIEVRQMLVDFLMEAYYQNEKEFQFAATKVLTTPNLSC